MKFLSYCTPAPTLSLVSETFVAEENDGSVEVCAVLNVPLTFVLDFMIVASDIGSATDGTSIAFGMHFVVSIPFEFQVWTLSVVHSF